jgi:HK97 family phage prohead protease
MKPKNKTRHVRNAAASAGVLELTMYDDIGENWWSGGGITAKWVKAKIETSGGYSSITVRIDSPGGDAFEGVTIYNLLRSQKKPVNVFIDGLAASAASVIAMAGDTITMGPGTMLMVHNASGLCMGEEKDMLKTAEVLSKVSLSIGEIYVARTGKTVDEVKAIMDAETWMRAQEAVDLNFATAVAKDGDADPLASAKGSRLIANYRNAPEEIKPKLNENGCECDCADCVAGDCPDCTNKQCDDPDCKDCPMQEGMDDLTPRGIQAIFSRMGTTLHAVAVDVPVRGKVEFLAIRKTGTAILNLAPKGTVAGSIGKISGNLAPYEAVSCDLGGWQEVYQRGCFADSALAPDDKIFYFNHNPDFILGCTAAKTARVVDEADGLHYEIDLPDTQVARDLTVLMDRQDVRGASAAFYVEKYRWENRGGIRTRVIEQARFVEGSPVGIAAYKTTSVASVPAVAVAEATTNLELIGARLQLLKIT